MKTRKLFLAVLVAITALTVGATGCKKRDAKPAPQVVVRVGALTAGPKRPVGPPPGTRTAERQAICPGCYNLARLGL